MVSRQIPGNVVVSLANAPLNAAGYIGVKNVAVLSRSSFLSSHLGEQRAAR